MRLISLSGLVTVQDTLAAAGLSVGTVTGNAAANTTETLGALTLNSGYSTVTLTPNAARNTQVTFASLARTAGASGLFRGNNLGTNTVGSQTAGASNIVFTAAPALTGGGGNSGTSTVSIVAGAIGAAGAAGSTSTGTDFVTYNPPTGAVNGLRPLLAQGTDPAAVAMYWNNVKPPCPPPAEGYAALMMAAVPALLCEAKVVSPP